MRDLDLHDRLLAHSLSYLIYTESFDALPDLARESIYARFDQIFSGREDSAAFGHLNEADRTALLEVLMETKPSFRAWMDTR